MYNRIFNVSRSFRYQLFASSGLVVGWWVGCTAATLTNCIPLKWSWINSFADPRYCFNYNIFWMASGACEIFLDVLILTLPISVVVRMHLSLRRKLTVQGIFLLGGLYVLLRFIFREQCANSPFSTIITGLVRVILAYPKGSRVPSYSNTEVWTTVHTGMSIVCASLPIFRPLVKRILGSSFMTKISSLLSIYRKEETHPSKESSFSARDGHVHVGRKYEDDGRMDLRLPTIPIGEGNELSLSAQWEGFLERGKSSGM